MVWPVNLVVDVQFVQLLSSNYIYVLETIYDDVNMLKIQTTQVCALSMEKQSQTTENKKQLKKSVPSENWSVSERHGFQSLIFIMLLFRSNSADFIYPFFGIFCWFFVPVTNINNINSRMISNIKVIMNAKIYGLWNIIARIGLFWSVVTVVDGINGVACGSFR